ncbi:LytR/AlgR family response regulator transcription factor [Flavilitoribacter nigricans]|uniref:DNA-binding response regulator n=1 Tax=Flavilitoribacter nigricans (strain ATCC 23147 / DSM 23189 / NBRC 102662 / NCIMB 1420 / SS-2) TaxID=1122177 RepID=A0A2D0NBZ0_FLAN2|nr:LytTR family DNA-binding domain-containing protein [Flavilitoribacter nigricans]PHN05898.1 DNA-binding response regulator [Flavilitoribacter nigricans DSM 23189 = NBRC 102662]
MKLRCLVVDDERLARNLLEENIRQLPFLELAGSCKNAFEAMDALAAGGVDLVFLDIQMPGMTGTKLLRSLPEKPLVIFVTAYDHYAVESYDLEVVDYLMKPVSLERFTKAAYRAYEIYKQKQILSKIPLQPAVATAPAPKEPAPTSFFVHVEYALVKINIPDVCHVESMKDYVKIYLETAKKPVITKSTLKAIEEKLPSDGFMRVHKSFIVNLEKIESIRNQQIQIGEHEIPFSDTHREELLQRLNYQK